MRSICCQLQESAGVTPEGEVPSSFRREISNWHRRAGLSAKFETESSIEILNILGYSTLLLQDCLYVYCYFDCEKQKKVKFNKVLFYLYNAIS